jgi:hypothetical protein
MSNGALAAARWRVLHGLAYGDCLARMPQARFGVDSISCNDDCALLGALHDMSNGALAAERWRVLRGLAYGVRVKRDRRLGRSWLDFL